MMNADLLTTLTRATALQLKIYGIKPADVQVIGSGVDADQFKPVNGKSKDEIYILYTGRLVHGKGLFDLIKSARYVIKEYPNSKFIVAGMGSLRDSLAKIVEKTGLTNNFKFVGHLSHDRLVDYYRNATIFVLPSYQEGLSLSLLEAMACALPCVVTNIENFTEIIEDKKTGLLVPPYSPKELANAIILLLQDENLRNKIGYCARRLIESTYTWQKVAERTMDCYRQLLDCRK